MTGNGHSFLRELAHFPAHTFEARFYQTCSQLDLGNALSCDELILLYEVAFYAALCNIAFNGLGGCHGAVKPERESTRLNLERAFMSARDAFYDSAGAANLSHASWTCIRRTFLTVFVAPDNFAW
jgi:hypothetical protein